MRDDVRDQSRAKPGSGVYLIVGGLLSVAAGLLLAIIAFGIVLALEGHPTEGGYCSAYGIGRYEAQTPPKMVVYLDEGWSGLPPTQHCKVFLADASNDNPPLSAEALLRDESPPRRLLAAGTYPGTEEYAWIVGVLLLPTAIWCLPLAIAALVRRRTTKPA